MWRTPVGPSAHCHLRPSSRKCVCPGYGRTPPLMTAGSCWIFAALAATSILVRPLFVPRFQLLAAALRHTQGVQLVYLASISVFADQAWPLHQAILDPGLLLFRRYLCRNFVEIRHELGFSDCMAFVGIKSPDVKRIGLYLTPLQAFT